ncbi:MAG: carbohydrate ABC transporter permease [Propionibacteriaceae bacterium]|jgi:raffinose/stachyose/melibiose transport system permease protein|nr:carbohydrate ABC transporter permease [Propionibacteriaceae bacterium]
MNRNDNETASQQVSVQPSTRQQTGHKTLCPRHPANPARGNQSSRPSHRSPAQWIVLIVVTIGAVVMLSPFIIMALNAFKSPADYSQDGPLAWPSEFYWQGVVTFWTRTDFGAKLWNSIWISATVAILATALSLLSAYAIGVGRVKGRVWLVGLFLLANMLPQEVLVYPLFTMAQQAHLGNSGWSIVIIFTVIQSAFGTYLLASVLGTFPQALLEAGQLDGASRWQILWRVVFPVVRPTCSVLMIFFFIWTWNEFFIPLIMLTSSDTQTVPIALAAMQGDRLMDVPTLNAGTLVSLIPTLIFFLIFQRTLTRGITVGAVK